MASGITSRSNACTYIHSIPGFNAFFRTLSIYILRLYWTSTSLRVIERLALIFTFVSSDGAGTRCSALF